MWRRGSPDVIAAEKAFMNRMNFMHTKHCVITFSFQYPLSSYSLHHLIRWGAMKDPHCCILIKILTSGQVHLIITLQNLCKKSLYATIGKLFMFSKWSIILHHSKILERSRCSRCAYFLRIIRLAIFFAKLHRIFASVLVCKGKISLKYILKFLHFYAKNKYGTMTSMCTSLILSSPQPCFRNS